MRYSVRAFEDKPVPKKLLTEILDYARYAACSKNMQPWKVFAVSGDPLLKIAEDMVAALDAKQAHSPARPDLEKPSEEYWNRARQCGFSLFQHKGIERDDKEKRHAHYAENYSFFSAPVELFFAMDKTLPQRQLIDMGIFLERVMHKADELGLGSCPQASVADFPDILQKHLNFSDKIEILFGLSLGYEDKSAHVNAFRTEKLDVDEFTNWIS